MNMLEAMRATVDLALERGYQDVVFDEVGVDWYHLNSMLERVQPNFSEAKTGRWLGYMQGVLVANGVATLEEMKELNKRFSDSEHGDWWHHPKRGSNYKIAGEIRLQCSTKQPQDGDMLTLYRDEEGHYSARLPEEFLDGRFVRGKQ